MCWLWPEPRVLSYSASVSKRGRMIRNTRVSRQPATLWIRKDMWFGNVNHVKKSFIFTQAIHQWQKKGTFIVSLRDRTWRCNGSKLKAEQRKKEITIVIFFSRAFVNDHQVLCVVPRSCESDMHLAGARTHNVEPEWNPPK